MSWIKVIRLTLMGLSLCVYISLLITGIIFFFDEQCSNSNIPKSMIQYSLTLILITSVCIAKYIISKQNRNHYHKQDCGNCESMLSIIQALSLTPWTASFIFDLLDENPIFFANCGTLIYTSACLLGLAVFITIFDISQFIFAIRIKKSRNM